MLTNVRNGGIEEIVLSCPGYTRTLVPVAGEPIQIPAEWHSCDARLKGTPDTEFDIVGCDAAA